MRQNCYRPEDIDIFEFYSRKIQVRKLPQTTFLIIFNFLCKLFNLPVGKSICLLMGEYQFQRNCQKKLLRSPRFSLLLNQSPFHQSTKNNKYLHFCQTSVFEVIYKLSLDPFYCQSESDGYQIRGKGGLYRISRSIWQQEKRLLRFLPHKQALPMCDISLLFKRNIAPSIVTHHKFRTNE
jgi:hypothetical protein